jgi:hypothetical protein
MTFPVDTFKAIQDSGKNELLKIGDDQFSTRPLYRVPTLIGPTTLGIATLGGLVDFIDASLDGAEEGILHVVSHDRVDLVRTLRDDNQREILLSATYEAPDFEYGEWMEQGEFITKLQSCFVDAGDRQGVQTFVAKLVADSSTHLEDDGTSQQTVLRSGAASVARGTVPNPVSLRPYRTFSEIDQPESNFVLRISARGERVPLVSLHEADNAAWKVEAIETIKGFFKGKVNIPVIA